MDSGARSTSRPDATGDSAGDRPAGAIDPRPEAPHRGGVLEHPVEADVPVAATDGPATATTTTEAPVRDSSGEAGPAEGPARPSKRWATFTKLLFGPDDADIPDDPGVVEPAAESPSSPAVAAAGTNGATKQATGRAAANGTADTPTADPATSETSAPSATFAPSLPSAPPGMLGAVLLPPVHHVPAASAEPVHAPGPAESMPASRVVVAPENPPSAPSTGEQVPTQVVPSTRVAGVAGEILTTRVLVPPPGTAPQPVEEPALLERRTPRTSVTFQRRSTRPRVRRVTRVLRHIDTWSMFKVALVFSVFLYAVVLTAGVLLWHVAMATGTIDNVERFFEGFGWQSFQFKGGEIYHNAWIGGLFAAVGLTGLAVLMATLFNLITDLVGGVRVSVLEEEVLARRDRAAAVVLEHDPDEGSLYDQARHG